MAAASPPSLDPKLKSLIADLRAKIRRFITIDGLLAALAVVAGLFWLGLALDFLPVKLGGTEMPQSARLVLLIIGGFLLFFYAIRPFALRMWRVLPDESLALLLERQHPILGGRLVTAVQLTRERLDGDLHSSLLLDRVSDEAIQVADQVEPARVLRWQPVNKKMAFVVPAFIATILLALISPATIALAGSRLFLLSETPWPRRADLHMVGLEVPLISAVERPEGEPVRLLEFDNKVVRVARGGMAVLRINAAGENSIVPEVCTMYYRTSGGLRGQVNMRRVGRLRNGLQGFALDGPPLAGITEDLVFSVRGLDDRLDDFQIQVVDPPSIATLEVAATYPPYLRPVGVTEGADLVTFYQPGLRLREGTSVRFVGKATSPVKHVEVAVTSGDQPAQIVPVEVASDGESFALNITDLRMPTSIVMVPRDENDISSPSPYRYFLGVVNDTPPEVQFKLRGIGSQITPLARLPIFGTAKDDYGITQLLVQLSVVGDDPTPVVSLPASTDRDGAFETSLDIRDLASSGQIAAPSPGTAYNVFGEVRDAYDLGDPHLVRSDLIRLEVVTPEELLAILERRELGLRGRLEATITEMQTLRDTLDLLRRDGWTPIPDQKDRNPTPSVGFSVSQEDVEPELNVDRSVQLLRLRIQQAGLQSTKTSEELNGVAASIDDILLEMVNNRVDTPDRSDRIAMGVRDPLLKVVQGPLQALRNQIDGLVSLVEDKANGPAKAAITVQTAEEVLLQLNAVLEKMLDLESYNEVLDLVRGLIDNQDKIIEATENERARSLQDLFKGFDQ